MRKLLFIFIFFISLTGIHAQYFKLPVDTEFFYLYGGTSFDEARCVKEIPGGGYILAGTSSSFGQGDASVYLVKTDSMGKHLWSACYGGTQNDWAYSVEVTSDSGYFVAGYSNSFNPSNGSDAYYFKTDKNGNLLWQKTVGGSDWDFIYGSTAMPDGGFILCGESYTNSNGGTDAYLIRLNKNGDTLWTKHYGGLFDETFNSVTIMNNQIYAVGKNATHAIDTVADGWIVKLDTNGNILKDTYITYPYRHFEEILLGITPYTNSIFHFCGKINLLDTNVVTSILGRADTALNLKWAVVDTNGQTEIYSHVINISYGSICIVGTHSGGLGGLGMFFVGFDYQGNFITDYAATDGGSKDDIGYSGIYTSQGRVIGVGSTQSVNDYCANASLGLEDVFLIRYNSDSIHAAGVIPKYNCYADTLPLWVVNVRNYTKDGTVSLFPNPVYGYATLKITGNYNEKLAVKVYSVLGEEILNGDVDSNKNNEINFSSLRAGSYFLKIQNQKGDTVSTIKFIVIN